MKGKFDAYVLWSLAKGVQNWIVDRSTARDFTVDMFHSTIDELPGMPWLSKNPEDQPEDHSGELEL